MNVRGSTALLLLAGLTAAAAMVSACTVGTMPVRPPAALPPGKPAVSPATAPDVSSEAATLPMTFAAIGDYGVNEPSEAAVSRLVASWKPTLVIALGDDCYPSAGGVGTAKYDASTGAYFGSWLKDISTTGTRLPAGKASVNGFFPALGNHDYSDGTRVPESYLAYFDLPGAGFENSSGNERYYDFVKGPVHFYALNSNYQEPDGVTATSIQGRWLRDRLAASTSRWNVVYDHHPPYSSDTAHGSTAAMQWPFHAWGADVVLSGHAHGYERVMRDGMAYLVNGLGGAPRRGFGGKVPGSVVRFSDDWGAQKVTVSDSEMVFEFYDTRGTLVDRYALSAETSAAPRVLQ